MVFVSVKRPHPMVVLFYGTMNVSFSPYGLLDCREAAHRLGISDTDIEAAVRKHPSFGKTVFVADGDGKPLQTAEALVCADCGFKARNVQGLKAHRRAKHPA